MVPSAIGNKIITVKKWEKQVAKMHPLLATASESDSSNRYESNSKDSKHFF